MWSHSGKKVVEAQLWMGHIGHDLGSHEGFTQYVLSHIDHFCLGIIFPSVGFLPSKVRGHNFWTHLKMCT